MDLFAPDFSVPDFVPALEEPPFDEVEPEHSPDILPDVRPAPQKGLGLSSLKESLSIFSENSQVDAAFDPEQSPEERAKIYARDRQERLERDAITAALERWRKENDDLKAMGINSSLKTKSVGSDLWTWSQTLESKIRRELREIERAENKRTEGLVMDKLRCEYGPFMGLLSPERLAAITIVGAMKTILNDGKHLVSLASVAVTIGQMLAQEYEAEMSLKKTDPNAMTSSSFNKRGEKIANMIRRKQQRKATSSRNVTEEPSTDPTPDYMKHTWTKEIQGKIGAILTSLLVDSATIMVANVDPETQKTTFTQQAVFSHDKIWRRGKHLGIIRTSPTMLEKLSKEPSSHVLTKQLPMVCEPKAWQNVRDGGFLTEKFDVLRWSELSQRRYLQTAADKGDLDEIFAGLDVLGRTPWKINRGVLKIMLEAWNSGAEIANFRAESPAVEYPPKPENMKDRDVKRKYHRAVLEVENRIGGYHSERCFHNLQLEIAKGYADETFYFPHNMDFRGRAYPLSSYLNQMGADHCRGLLMFADGKPLGPNGLRWLKIHLANVFGFDKASLQEREGFAMKNLSEVYDSASGPLNGNKWWLKAEDPWQTLATCIELKRALDSPDPTAYVCHLPVHQDGSCNGLQHYAALGGDLIGAQQVNLEPGDRPADVYTGVAEMVKKEINDDAAAGVQIAKDLQGKITRKVVKQPVMTNVYGVTFVGAKAQVKKQLVNLIPGLPFTGEGFTYDNASNYIAKKIFKSLSAMFTGAHEIQSWFGLCGARIAVSLSPNQINKIEHELSTAPQSRKSTSSQKRPDFRTSIIWTTPLKLPVVQPYRKESGKQIRTVLQELTIQSPNNTHKVDKRRQLQGFPPNFIHSLDATHMIMSALKCNEIGLTFAAVHDSFWTHASDIDTMSRVLRDAFIRMHSDNIIGRLAAEFKARYKDYMYLCQVPSNSAVGKKIKTHRREVRESIPGRASGLGKLGEVVLERKRLRLLQSDDPKEVEEGKKMVTPGSIYAEHLSQSVSTVHINSMESDVAPHQLGHVPKTPEQIAAAEEAALDAENTVEDVFAEGASHDIVASGEAEVEGGKPDEKTKKGSSSKIWVWLPLAFPEVPEKGTFDVGRLRESIYFFS
jgi:DNA-directed RNA polymerase